MTTRTTFLSMTLTPLRLRLAAVLVALSVTLGGLGLVQSASAAAPEAPQMKVESRTATSAFLHGILNPGVEPPQEGTYEFVYAASPSICTGESKARRGLSFGFSSEEVNEEISGLASHTTYTVCLLDRNMTGEETLSAPETFTTSYELEAPETGAADAITASTAMLHGTLNPNGSREEEPGFYEFIYKRSSSECEGEGSTGQLSAATGAEKEAVLVEATGLAPNTQYTFCLRAWNSTGQFATGSPVAFTTLPAKPSISGEAVSKLGSASATVSAEIATGGIDTAYSVQYGTTGAYGNETPPATISSGTQTVSVAIAGLQPNTQYHFRFTASNHEGVQDGNDLTFTTYPPEASLPDNRVYEMVTPPSNHDADVLEPFTNSRQRLIIPPQGTEHPFQASRDGNRVAYVVQNALGGNGSDENEYVAARSPQGGWTQTDVTPAGSQLYTQYEAFSGDLTTGILTAEAEAPFLTTSTLHEVTGKPSNLFRGLYARKFSEEMYRPLYTKEPAHRGKADAVEYGFGAFPAGIVGGTFPLPVYAGSSADMSHLFFEANDSLLEGGGPLQEELEGVLKTEAEEMAEALELERGSERRGVLEGLGDRNELYMSVEGQVSLVNVLPDGKLAPGATFGGEPRNEDWPERGFVHAISTDGSRVFWSTVETGVFGGSVEFRPGIVYVREHGSSTMQVSQGPAQFWDASPDGKYAFYVEAGKLWRFDVEAETRVELAGSGGGVQGVIGVNETGADGAYVYFVSQEALAGPANTAGRLPVAGQNNLYVYEPDPQNAGASRIAFVASLSTADHHDWEAQLGERLANLTPDGRGLVFIAHENLTSGAYPGEGSEQVYVYDTRDGSLFCASCRPQASGGYLQASGKVVYEHRHISEGGDRVFYDSTAPLVTQDVNGEQDVYEWERDGSGPCHESVGCVYLLSDGLKGAAFLIDASVSGDDVFMVTRQRLVVEDGNENADVYDVRVDGAQPVAPPQCTGTGCQGAPGQAPIFATPSSVTFSGVGNFVGPGESAGGSKPKSLSRAQKLRRALAACHRKRQKRKRVVCEARARKLYGNKAKRSMGGTK